MQSPESYCDLLEGYDPFKADVWALGVCLYILLKKKLPFESKELDEKTAVNPLITEIHHNAQFEMRYSLLIQQMEPNYEGLSPELTELLRGMLSKNSATRFGIHQVLQSAYFSKL